MYEDIINMSYPTKEIDADFPDKVLREAQFAPFAALTGHDEAVEETARLTDCKRELDECLKQELNRKLIYISEHLREDMVKFTYFLPDEKKSGGEYVSACDRIKRVDEYERKVILLNGDKIQIDDILDIEIQEEASKI